MARLAPASSVGRFRISGLIGTSDLAEVYEVQDASGNAAALKLFAVDLSRAPSAWAAFEQESRAFAAATPGAAAVYEFGIEPSTHLPFLIREKLLIGSLYDEVLRGGPLAVPRVAAMLQALAPALDAAHAKGLTHRALKPQNVFSAGSGIGEAVSVRLTDSSTYLLRSAQLNPPGWAGSPGWVGADAADANTPSTARMDVYAVGLICFFALTGRPLFRAFNQPTLDFDALWNEMIQPIQSASQQAREVGSTLGSALDPWFAQAIAPHPRGRFGSVSEMAAQFAARVGGLASGVRAPSLPATPKPAAGKKHATQLGLGPLAAPGGGTLGPGGGTLVLDPKETAAARGAAAPARPVAAGATPAADPRALGGTLIMDLASPHKPAAGAPVGTVATLKQFAAPSTAPADFQQDAGIRPAASVAEDHGPVVLASGQPLAFMRELPRAAAPMPETVAFVPETMAEPAPVIPTKRGMLLPILLFGGAGLLALSLIVGFLMFRRGSDNAPTASASAGAAPPASLEATSNGAKAPAAAGESPAAKTPTLPASGSAATPAESPPVDGLITFHCEPACEKIVCDGQAVDIVDDGARLAPGKHVCRLEKPGFVSKTETFVVTTGQPQTREAVLKAERALSTASPPKSTAGHNATPTPPKRKQPCGTFINPCK